MGRMKDLMIDKIERPTLEDMTEQYRRRRNHTQKKPYYDTLCKNHAKARFLVFGTNE